MSNTQNERKYYPRDEKGYYDVPDVHEKRCPTCAYRGKCYVDDVHSWPWTTSECVKAGYVHYRPKYSGYDSSIVKLHVCDDVIPNEEFERSRKVSSGVIDLCDLMSPEDKEQLEKMHQGILDSINLRKREAQKQYEMQKEIERLKADNDRLRGSRACGQWIAIKHPYTNSRGTCEIEDEFHCPFCNVASDSRTNFCSNCGSYLRGVIDEQV